MGTCAEAHRCTGERVGGTNRQVCDGCHGRDVGRSPPVGRNTLPSATRESPRVFDLGRSTTGFLRKQRGGRVRDRALCLTDTEGSSVTEQTENWQKRTREKASFVASMNDNPGGPVALATREPRRPPTTAAPSHRERRHYRRP